MYLMVKYVEMFKNCGKIMSTDINVHYSIIYATGTARLSLLK